MAEQHILQLSAKVSEEVNRKCPAKITTV